MRKGEDEIVGNCFMQKAQIILQGRRGRSCCIICFRGGSSAQEVKVLAKFVVHHWVVNHYLRYLMNLFAAEDSVD